MKRIAGIFLAALLALTVLPHGAELVTSDDVTKGIVTTAYAEENTITISSDTTWDENCEYFVRATSLGGMDYIKLPGNLVVNSGATLTVSATVYLAGDATISGSGTIKRGADFGGAMFRIENRTLTIEGNVTFDGSSSGAVYRSVIEIPSRGVVNLKSGTICNNNISYNGYDTNMIGGGVWVGATGTLNMYGGTITGNEASYGGGVYAYGTINMSGGEIKNNTARVDGGGVYGAYTTLQENAAFQVSKTATIKGNHKAGTDNNVYLEENRKIEVVEALTQGAEVVVNSGSTSQITGSGNYSMTENTEDGSVTLKAPTGGGQPTTYTVTIVPGEHIKTNGQLTQEVTPGYTMSSMFFYPADGYYFSKEYTTSQKGVTASYMNPAQIMVTGTPTDNVTLTLPEPGKRLAGTVRIVGTAQVGQTLTAVLENGDVDQSALAYQWEYDYGATGEYISGATNSTYTLTEQDVGKRILVQVSKAGEPGGAIYSATVGPIEASSGGEEKPETPPRYYYNSTAAADTKADGSKTGSPKTFDAGVGIYAVSAVLSLTGMAYVGKKKF